MSRADHGYARYTSRTDPCRCDICRKAKADYMRRRRAQARARARFHAQDGRRYIAQNITHGTRHGYEEHGCRCEPCVTARTESDTKYERIARARALLTDPEHPITAETAARVIAIVTPKKQRRGA